jgi:hypothetical protein
LSPIPALFGFRLAYIDRMVCIGIPPPFEPIAAEA